MTNREFHEICAGISLSEEFFKWNDINPDEEYVPNFEIDEVIDITKSFINQKKL